MRTDCLEAANVGDVLECSNGDFSVLAVNAGMAQGLRLVAMSGGTVVKVNGAYAVVKRIPCNYVACDGRKHG